jgi:hypothetical protein
MSYNSANRSERLLQNRRFTTDALTLSQEAFTSVLDLNSTEIYTQNNYIPTASTAIPFSGSSQNGLIVSASVVQPGISPDLPILKYWWRKKMKPAADATQQVYYFTTSDPSSPTNTVASDQLIESDQLVDFVSPKYIIPANSSFNSEANPPGYKVIVYKSTSTTAAGITEAAALDSTFVFDYKTGVLSWLSGFAPSATQYVYITAYQYVGEKLNSRLSSISSSIAAVSASMSTFAGGTTGQIQYNTGTGLGGVPTATYVNNTFVATGSFSGSFSGDGSGLTGIAATLGVSGSTGNGTVDLKNQAFTIAGTSNEVETSMSGQTLTVGLPDNVTISNNLTVSGDLLVNGTASFQNTENLLVADRFVLFASGSVSTGDGGIVVQQGTQNVGELFGYDADTTRWGFTSSFSANSTGFTPVVYVGAVQTGTGQTAASAAPIYGGSSYGLGTIHIDTDDSEIWIYA